MTRSTRYPAVFAKDLSLFNEPNLAHAFLKLEADEEHLVPLSKLVERV